MRISYWSSDVFSAYLICLVTANAVVAVACPHPALGSRTRCRCDGAGGTPARAEHAGDSLSGRADRSDRVPCLSGKGFRREAAGDEGKGRTRRFPHLLRSEEHTSELQSLMRTSYAVFCLKKKKN